MAVPRPLREVISQSRLQQPILAAFAAAKNRVVEIEIRAMQDPSPIVIASPVTAGETQPRE
jgi:hypothetical protein